MSAARPPEGAKAPLGGSGPRAAGERGGQEMSAARPSEGANAPLGGSGPREAGERGGQLMSAARPPEGAKAPLGGSGPREAGERAGLHFTWPVQALRAQLAPRLPGLGVEVAAQIDSTNTELMRRVRAGLAAPVLLAAERQSAGRGRLGRAWDGGEPGATLAFSLALPLAPRDWSGLSLAVGLSLAESLHSAIGLKWPNDLWWQDRKLAGVLVETAGGGAAQDGRWVVIGVGLNLTPRAVAGASTPPAGLQELLPGIDAPGALARIALPLAQAVQAFEHDGFAPLAARFNARDVLAGRPVRLSDGTEGVARGVGPDGALQVDTAHGRRVVSSAEVSVRPTAQPPMEGGR